MVYLWPYVVLTVAVFGIYFLRVGDAVRRIAVMR